ncbi:alpha-(1-_3)-arabinofuranosyltransferase family protein [Streptomyces sp. HNM0574]|uniref:alpha-(1->3)-arabinofuranosyltransferase domain-containing protein n=1 Tax=Streptomyces sp. HNM0574 TaxID=2714954 RepID=UPI00146D7D26|nr:alpha-(1->3)-arabinofuranosyltransferase family protein [Streptomyces sp. HNM0574]NLU69237.1 DUF3367 domain-containing protein [Streptomyces sp. HNM0574]
MTTSYVPPHARGPAPPARGAPPDAGRPGTAPAPAEPGGRRHRGWLLGVWAALFAAFLAKSPGRMTFETKLGVATDPWRFLGDLGGLWHDTAGFGGITDQYAGYLFPMLPYYGLTDLARIPTWLAERLWLSLVVAAAFWGALRLAERLGTGSPRTRLLAALCYALWPTFTVVVGSTSAAALPGAALPWVLLPLLSTTLTARVAAARSALLIPFMGGVNAASTLASLLPVGLYLLTRTGRRRRSLLAWWLPGVVLATLWWTVPLLLLGRYGEDFMPYVESARTTTGTMSATEMLRGAGNWTAYLNFGEPWLPAGWAVATGLLTVLAGAFAAALGLAGLARRDLPERRWLVLTVTVVSGIMLAGYAGALGGPFAETVQSWLDGALRPFRNIYKFQPGLALALALGLAHLLAVAFRTRLPEPDGAPTPPDGGTVVLPRAARHAAPPQRTAAPRATFRRLLPGLAALLLLPGLALPYATGDILQPGAFKELPAHWRQTADWLEKHSPDSRAYVTPATAHGIHTWGSPIDQPLDVLASSPWAQRDYVPFGTPGNRRAMDAVEQALTTGGEVPGLRAFLNRAGLHDVVVRNDLDPDQIGYVPPQTVKRTLEASGYRKVKSFGPLLTGGRIPGGTPLQVAGFYPRQRAVEIYEPVGTERPSQAALKPVADTAQVSGGPEALLQLADDPRLKDRPTVLTGDGHPGLAEPSLQVTADGMRRADTRFGLVNTNTSYTYTARERNHPDSAQNPGEEPKQILPTEGTEHQTVSVVRGASSVTASSSGNWLFHLPQFDPVGAFDGDPETAWAEGSTGEPEGQWLRVGFDEPVRVPSSLEVTPLPAEATRAAPTRVRVETDEGSRTSTLRTDGSRQRIAAPRGSAEWLRLTIVDAQKPRPGLSGAGFAEVRVPGVQLTRLLRLPSDAAGGQADGGIVSLHRGSDPGALSPAAAERGLHRQFRTDTAARHTLTARALPQQGAELDRLLDRVAPGSRNRITASADSTSRTGTQLSARNLVDGDLSTAWIAGDKPTIRLSWPGKKEIDEMVLAGAGGISARPEEIRISSPDGAATAGVDKNGQARFEPIRTDRLTVTVTKTRPLTVHNPLAGKALQLPVGLNEVYLPALKDLRVPPPDPDRRFTVPCGQGPAVSVDGTLHTTRAEGTVRDLTERRPVDVELCAGKAEDGRLTLEAGRHTVESAGPGALAVTDITLSGGEAAKKAGSAASSSPRGLSVTDWSGDSRAVRVGEGSASYLQIHQNVNEGWKATLDGEQLTPLRLDGWQQGFLVPAGAAGDVRLEYEPARWYDAGFLAAGAGLLALLGLAFLRRRGGTPLGDDGPPPAPGAVLGTLAVTLVVALAAGPYAVLVPVLAVAARFRPRLLVPVALSAMAGAGVAAAVGVPSAVAEGQGAFGHPAQALALLALSAALVTFPRRGTTRGSPPEDTGRPENGGRTA